MFEFWVNNYLKNISLFFFFLLSFVNVAHVFWNFPVPGCLSVCVHPASFKSLPGAVQALHSALLWPAVSLDLWLFLVSKQLICFITYRVLRI